MKIPENIIQPAVPLIGDSIKYVDGVYSVSVRNGVAKIDFYEAIGPSKDGDSEVRRVSHRIVLPLVALSELAEVLSRAMKVQAGPSSKLN